MTGQLSSLVGSLQKFGQSEVVAPGMPEGAVSAQKSVGSSVAAESVHAVDSSITQVSGISKDVEEVVGEGPLSKPSWASLVGGSSNPTQGMKLNYVPPRLVDGKIHLSPQVLVVKEGAKTWANCIVGHLIGAKLPSPVVNFIAKKIWAKEGPVEVLAQEHGFFFFKFSNGQGKGSGLWTLVVCRSSLSPAKL